MNPFANFRYAVNTVAPCKGCPNRSPLCHASCEDYISFRKKHEENVAHYTKHKEECYGLYREKRKKITER